MSNNPLHVQLDGMRDAIRDSLSILSTKVPPSSEVTHERSGLPRWVAGACTAKGSVRRENEDYATTVEVNGSTGIVIADGCGGGRFGRLASETAAMAAASSLRASRTFRKENTIRTRLELAFQAAEEALRETADELEKETPVGNGLRTTLVVAIRSKKQFSWGYIGDGAIELVARNGEHRSLLKPHREEGGPSNLLLSSLGPMTVGTPEYGGMLRQEGDFLFVASDGIADRVTAEFYKELLRRCLLFEGNFEQALDEMLAELSEQRTDCGAYLFDDNMSLGIVGSGKRPRFAPGFWKIGVRDGT